MLFRCFSSSVWHVTPLLILGQLKLYFNNLTMKYTLKSGVGVSDWCYWSECSPNGGIQWVLRKPRTSSIGRCVQYSTAASRWPSKWSAKWTHFASSFCLLLPWRPPGRYGASSHPMVAFSGLYESTGPSIGWCARYCTVAPPWLSKWPVVEVLLFIVAEFFAWHNCS